MTIAVPLGGLVLSIGDDGQPSASLTFHVHFDVCPTWLGLAAQHLALAKERKLSRIAAWNSSDENAKAAAIEREFESSMQAVMSAGVAIDSFYAMLKHAVKVPKDVVESWRKNKTARYAQIAEVIRMAFPLIEKDFLALRGNLKEIFRLRNMAVHPSGELQLPIPHPELDVEVEWRFAYFRADNACRVVDGVQSIISELVTRASPSNDEVRRYAEALRERIAAADYLAP